MEKIWGEWKKICMGGNCFFFFKCFAFSQETAFPHKTFAFSRKYICVLSSSDKLFLFTLQLAVVHVHNGAVHKVLFWTL